jgi:protein O-mannosyl-transferase
VLGLRPFMMQYTSTVTDHYLYLPMLGVAIAFTFLIARLGRSRAVPAVCAILFAALALCCSVQAGYWQNDETLCRHAIAVNPDSFPAHLNLGHVFEQQGDFKAELHEFAEAVRANPNFPLSRGNYATMLATLGHVPEAEVQCRELMRLARPLPGRGQQAFVATYAFVGRQLLHTGHPDRAIPFLREALRLQPAHDEALAAMAEARSRLANLSDVR